MLPARRLHPAGDRGRRRSRVDGRDARPGRVDAARVARSSRVAIGGGRRHFKVEYYELACGFARASLRHTRGEVNGLMLPSDPQTWIALATLTFLEIVLGVDNIIFISILSGKLPPDQQARARRLGLLGAMVTRILLLFSLAWIIRLTAPLFTIARQEISGRDLILIIGGLFLIAQEHARDPRQARRARRATPRAASRRRSPASSSRSCCSTSCSRWTRSSPRSAWSRAVGDGDGGDHRGRHHAAVRRADQRRSSTATRR